MGKPTATLEACDLEDSDVCLRVLNLGAVTQGWWVPCAGSLVPVILGYRDRAAYQSDTSYLGAIVGRVANRTAGSVLAIERQTYHLSQNEGTNHLHGGFQGLHKRVWNMDMDSANRAVRLSYISPDGEEGYPGEARFLVTIMLHGSTVTYGFEAQVDRPTPINMAQHNYYNLAGHGTIWDHHLMCTADRMTPTGAGNIPTGAIEPVDGSSVDFRGGSTFADADPRRAGTDINLVLPEGRDPAQPIAQVRAPNGLRLRMWSDQPGLQLYTGAGLSGDGTLHANQHLAPFSGFCLEPQGFPNAVNTPSFPSVMVTPDAPYWQTTRVEIVEVTP